MMIPARTPEERAMLIAYLASKVGVGPDRLVGAMPFEIAAIQVGGKPLGAVLYTNKRQHSVEMTWAGEAGWLTIGNIRQMFSHAFGKLGCLVAIGAVDARNQKSRDLAERLGCRKVGVIPHLFGEERDGILYCMARDECRWLNPRPREATIKMNGAAHGERCTRAARS